MITEPRIEAWLRDHQPEDDLLRRMREAGEGRDFPIIGPLVGRLCQVFAKSIQAKRIIELGSGFGYSTVHFARVVGPEGEVVHTDNDPDLSEEARRWLAEDGTVDRVRFEVGDALEIAAAEKGPFDVVFCDIDKHDYPRAWQWAKENVRVGGLVITDNTLWQGKVADPEDQDDWTNAVRSYDEAALEDDAFLTTIVPVRDGLAVSLRIK